MPANPENLSPLALAPEKKPVVELSEKLKKYERFLTVYRYPLPRGVALILPIVRGYGAIDWEIRLHGKGIVGPLAWTDEHFLMLGGTPSLMAEIEAIRNLLAKQFMELPAPIRIKLADELRKQLA